VADIPGLIEGAHENKGMGDEFLRHIERTSVLVFVLDGSDLENPPQKAYEILQKELSLYSPKLLEKPRIIVINKIDLPETQKRMKEIDEWLKSLNIPYIFISAKEGINIDKFLEILEKYVKERKKDIPAIDVEKEVSLKELNKEIEVPLLEKNEKNIWILKDDKTEKMANKLDLYNPQAFAYFSNYIKRRGIIKLLNKYRVSDGDMVKIGDYMFVFDKKNNSLILKG
jgi:Obg family GTPase CgtA, C-terminal extension